MNDTERLAVLKAINDFRSNVKPTAADMLAIVKVVIIVNLIGLDNCIHKLFISSKEKKDLSVCSFIRYCLELDFMQFKAML